MIKTIEIAPDIVAKELARAILFKFAINVYEHDLTEFIKEWLNR